MKRWLIALLAFLSVLIVSRAQLVSAASATGTLTIEKRVSVASSTATNQQTKPLAGARYELVRVQPVGPGPIDPARPATYRVLSGALALNVSLITDAAGEAHITGLFIGADYVLTELPGNGVPKPAAPVWLRFSAARSSYVYTPKSGLITVVPETKPTPGERIGNGTRPQKPRTILQTGGKMTHPLRWLVVLMAGALAGVMLCAFSLGGERRHLS